MSKKTDTMKTLGVRIPEAELQLIKQLGREEDRNDSTMGRVLIKEALAARNAYETTLNQASA
jgi:hypothetical protein